MPDIPPQIQVSDVYSIDDQPLMDLRFVGNVNHVITTEQAECLVTEIQRRLAEQDKKDSI